MKRPLIGLAISASMLVLGIGLCGSGAFSHQTPSQGSLAFLGFLAMALGALGGAVCLIWLVVAIIRGR